MNNKEILAELRAMGHTLIAIAKNFENGESLEKTQDAIEYAISELQALLHETRK
jgi:hypothetical protein